MGKSKLLLKLECPVCKRYMRPPIYMCEVGHSICKDCTLQLTTCAICRKILTRNLRNYLVESMCEEISFPCNYYEKGCTFFQKLEALTKHEKEQCCFRPLPCPIQPNNGCEWEDDYEKLKNHIEQFHRDQTIYYESELEFYHHKENPIFFIYCFGNLFQVCQTDGVFHVHMIGPGMTAINFQYVFTLTDSRYTNFTFRIENSCNEKCNKNVPGIFKVNLPAFQNSYDFIKCKVSIKNKNE